jgi:hypothetical protein
MTRALEADREQIVTLLMALRNVRDRANPKSLLPYVSESGAAYLNKHGAHDWLANTIEAFRKAQRDIDKKLTAQAEADDAACAASAVA